MLRQRIAKSDRSGTPGQRLVSRKSEQFNTLMMRRVPTSISGLLASALCLLTMISATAEPRPATVPSTAMEAALEALRARFPDQVVIGFEELWDVRPEREPEIDLGPTNSTLEQVLARIRRENPKYRIELLQSGLVHVRPATGTADPVGLLDIRLREFFLPPDDCVAQQLLNMDRCAAFSYTPELSTYLCEHWWASHRAHDKEPFGVAGDFLGDCKPTHHRHEPIYHDITVREALNLMAITSLQISRGQLPTKAPTWAKRKPISWKYRFRRDPDADTGLGGVPIIQTF